MLIQTVSTVSFLPFVAVMINSAHKHNSSFKFSILLTDVNNKSLPNIREKFENFKINIQFLCCDDLGFDFFPKLREYYSVLEFNSACKVLALTYQILMKKEVECLFLDPDIFILDNFEQIFKKNSKDILVTPHTLAPYPEDGEDPQDIELALAGHINGGIVYVRNSEHSVSALEWLVRKTKFEWFIAPGCGMYADQKWLSALPYFFSKSTCVLTDPAINIAYWNLHERKLSELQGKIMVNNVLSASLFHFSGFTIPSNNKLTKHTNRRFDDGTEKVLKKLISEYESKLLEQHKRFSGLEGDIKFCNDPLEVRMARAEKIWGIKYLTCGIKYL
jgi:hypothetical protein